VFRALTFTSVQLAPAWRTWLVAAGLALGPASTQGLARFAYGLLLPGMRDDLGWSFALAGTLSTANALGYLVGALLAAPLAARAGSQRAFIGGLGLTALSLLLSAATLDVDVLVLLRAAAGVSSAVAFIAGAALAARASPSPSASILAIYFGGAGLGIAASSLVVPPLVELAWPHAWRLAWLALGLVAAASLPPAVVAASRVPASLPVSGRGTARWSPRTLAPTLGAFALFGAGYIVYMTFIVAQLRSEGLAPDVVSSFWAVLGGAACASAFGWGAFLGRLPGGRGPALVLGMVLLGAALPFVVSGVLASFASAVVFGGAFMGFPTAVSALVKRVLPARAWTAAISMMTVVFALGQIAGPIVGGVLADGSGGVRAALGLAVGLLAGAMLIATAQRERPAYRSRVARP
jgi:predicted MFS family arabinose efflux permease